MPEENFEGEYHQESSPEWQHSMKPMNAMSPMSHASSHASHWFHGGYAATSSSMTAPSLMHTLQACESMCHHTITSLHAMPDVPMRFQQLQLLRECARTCEDTAHSLTIQSPFVRKKVKLCAAICEACGRECLRFPDSESQKCADMCLQCAHECRMFVGIHY